MTDRELGASQERRRIVTILVEDMLLHRLEQNTRIAHVLDTLITKIQHDHRQDNEQ